ncbi:MAG: hypothetical protein HRU19_13565 [Pseudobacteriovorax sp.]|nr:hypothetical protein [Pseudobacteriovorax sp.]
MRLKLQSAVITLLFASGCDSSPPPFKELAADYTGNIEDINPSEDLKGYSTLASAEWTLNASDIESASVEFDLQAETVKQFNTMANSKAQATIEHVQIDRAQSVEIFQQGTDEQAISEFFKQNENDDAQGLLDILIVIDNSGSMAEEQNNLSTKLLPLLSYVEEADWQIGVVTTDASDGCMRDVIAKGQANIETAFADAIKAGINGTGIEAGIPQAVAALSPGCVSANGWLRPNSTLAVLIVSDEDNCSDGTQCAIAEHNSADYLLDHLNSIREPGINARVFGLIWHSSQAQSQCSTAYRQGNIYSDLIDATSGSWGSICDNDYSSTLQAMSLDLSLILKTQFALNYEPFLDSVEVTINDQVQTSGYSITGNVIEFDDAPDPGARIYVNYRFTTADPQSAFTLQSEADANAIKVYLDGNETDQFTYDAASRKVSFTRPPQAREIKVTYRGAGDLVKDFAVEAGLAKDDITAYIDGNQVSITNFSYNPESGIVSFTEAPGDGQTVKFDYSKVVGPKLGYAVFAPEDALDSVRVYDGFGTPIESELVDRVIVISEDEFELGRDFVIEFDNNLQAEDQLDLGFTVYNDSLKVSGQLTGECAAPVMEGTNVDLSSCGFDPSEIISMNFDFVKEHRTSFVLEDTEEIGLDEILSGDFAYVVKVNGEVTQEYSISDSEISFDELPIGAVISVKLFRGQDS